MKLQPLPERSFQHKKTQKAYQKTQELIAAVNEHELPESLANELNQEIQSAESLADDRDSLRPIRSLCGRIRNAVRKELELVPPGFHQGQWMALGMTIFGLPFGVVFSTVMKNPGLIAIGLPIWNGNWRGNRRGAGCKGKERGPAVESGFDS